MDNWIAFFAALGSNVVSLLSGILGLIATVIGLANPQATFSKIFFWVGIVALIFSPAFAWIDEHKARVELETVRPSVLVEPISAGDIASAAMSDSRNQLRQIVTRGYVFAKAPDGDLFIYSTREVSGKTTARQVRHYVRVSTLEANGREVDVPVEASAAQSEVLLPGQAATGSQKLPTGTVFTGQDVNASEYLRVRLVVAYMGQPSDRRTYFYKIVLKIQRHKDPEAATTRGAFGGVTIEFSDDGVTTNPLGLLQ